MRVAIIGRTEALLDTARLLYRSGHEIAAIVTSKEAPEYKATANDFRAFARELAVPFFQTSRVSEFTAALKDLPPMDLGVSMNYTAILTQEVLDIFRLGVLNAHGGDLPRYRGNACQAWAILNGEDRVGLCIHRMIGGEVDAGDIIVREYFPIHIETKVTEILAWIYARTPILFSQALTRLQDNPSYVLARNEVCDPSGFRCYPRRPEDGRIDWHQDNSTVLRLINACNKPYAGAFCELEGSKLVIWDACLGPEERICAIPGQILRIEQDSIDVACMKGVLRIRHIEFEGKILPPAQIVRSIRQRLT